MFKKVFTVYCLAFACLLLLSGCSSQKNSETGKRFAILTYTNSDTCNRNLIKAMQQTASQNGASTTVFNANNSSDKQIAQLKKAVKAKYDAILIRPVEANNAQEMIALAGKTPVIFYNSEPDEDVLVANKDIYVGPDEKQAGQLQAKYILQKFAQKQTINVAILQGANSISSNKRTNALKDGLEASNKKINYVFEDDGQWDEQTAQDLMSVFLKTKQKVDVLAANNDDMANGAIKAFQKANHKLPIICGIDASAVGKKDIKQGVMQFSALQNVNRQGKLCIKAATLLSNKQKVASLKGASASQKYVLDTFTPVTAQNVDNY